MRALIDRNKQGAASCFSWSPLGPTDQAPYTCMKQHNVLVLQESTVEDQHVAGNLALKVQLLDEWTCI